MSCLLNVRSKLESLSVANPLELRGTFLELFFVDVSANFSSTSGDWLKCALLRGVDPKSDVLSLPTIIPQNTGDSQASIKHGIIVVYRYGGEVPVRQSKHVLKYDSRELSHATRFCGIFLPVQNRVTTKRHPNRITWSCVTSHTEPQQMGTLKISSKAAARPEGVFFSHMLESFWLVNTETPPLN